MENRNQSILILKNYIFNSRIITKKDQNYEIWSGRIRNNHEKLKAYIFYTPLKKEIIKEINKWIILGKYEISADKVIRYIEFFITTSSVVNNNEPISVLIIQISDHCITLETLLKTRLDIEDQIKYFNQLIKIFYSFLKRS